MFPSTSSQETSGLRATREKMASPFASMASEEITQINYKAVPENTKKVTKFGLAVRV